MTTGCLTFRICTRRLRLRRLRTDERFSLSPRGGRGSVFDREGRGPRLVTEGSGVGKGGRGCSRPAGADRSDLAQSDGARKGNSFLRRERILESIPLGNTLAFAGSFPESGARRDLASATGRGPSRGPP